MIYGVSGSERLLVMDFSSRWFIEFRSSKRLFTKHLSQNAVEYHLADASPQKKRRSGKQKLPTIHE